MQSTHSLFRIHAYARRWIRMKFLRYTGIISTHVNLNGYLTSCSGRTVATCLYKIVAHISMGHTQEIVNSRLKLCHVAMTRWNSNAIKRAPSTVEHKEDNRDSFGTVRVCDKICVLTITVVEASLAHQSRYQITLFVFSVSESKSCKLHLICASQSVIYAADGANQILSYFSYPSSLKGWT